MSILRGVVEDAWNKYTQESFPWVDNVVALLITVVLAPVLALFSGVADLVETWSDELLINQIEGLQSFVVELIETVFYGDVGRVPISLFGGSEGLFQATVQSFSGPVSFVRDAGLPGFILAVVLVIILGFVVGQVISGG